MATKAITTSTTLFDGNVNYRAGQFESNPFNVSGRKQDGAVLTIDIQVAEGAFPDGTTTLTIFFSLDGGATYPKSASMTVVRPRDPSPRYPAFEEFSYSLGENDNPTHAKYSSDAPSAFTARTIVSVIA